MKQMIKVGQRHGWTACEENDGCGAADGRTVVWVTETEEVVSAYTSPPFTGRLDNPPQNNVPGAIDGFRTFIKDTSQSIRFLSGKTIDDYKHFVESFIGGPVFNDQQDPYRWACKLVNQPFPKDLQNLDWTKTSIIIMDVWDRHKLRGDAMRTNELARPINEFISRARKKGALIIHSPSSSDSGPLDDTIQGRYDGTPQRKMAIDARGAHRADPQWQRQDFYYLGLPGERAFDWIVGSGNDWAPEGVIAWNQGIPTQQNAGIRVFEGDAMSADGLDGSGDGNAFQEVLALTKDRPYMVYVGTATNQCVIRRTNGMRNLYKAGKSLWIVKDLTDAAVGNTETGLTDYAVSLTADQVPHGTALQGLGQLNHFRATELIVDWLGWNLGACTATSDKAFPDLQRFWFLYDPDSPVEKAKPNYPFLKAATGTISHYSLATGDLLKLVAGAQSNQAIRVDEKDTTNWKYHAWSQDLGRPNQARELLVEVLSMNPDKIALRSNSMSPAYGKYVSWSQREGALRADPAIQPVDGHSLDSRFTFYLEPFPGNADWFYIAMLAREADGPRLYYLGATVMTNDFSELVVSPATDRLAGRPGNSEGYLPDGKTRYIFYLNKL